MKRRTVYATLAALNNMSFDELCASVDEVKELVHAYDEIRLEVEIDHKYGDEYAIARIVGVRKETDEEVVARAGATDRARRDRIQQLRKELEKLEGA